MLDARFVRENPDVVQQAMAVRNCRWESMRFSHSTRSAAG